MFRAAVLDRVVQQCRDALVLVAAVLQRDAGHAEQMVEVGDPAALACLLRVRDAGVVDGLGETFAQDGHEDSSKGTTRPA